MYSTIQPASRYLNMLMENLLGNLSLAITAFVKYIAFKSEISSLLRAFTTTPSVTDNVSGVFGPSKAEVPISSFIITERNLAPRAKVLSSVFDVHKICLTYSPFFDFPQLKCAYC
uniref:Uncharacterized protein n=1 Tax=Megaselia scalaris TaxID=36166 RepID=T1GIK0_MEGSC